MNKFKKLCGIVLAASLCAAVTGCGQNKEESQYPVIGVKEEGAFDILLKNSIGKDITGLAVKTDAEENYSDNILAKDFVLKNGETAELFYLPKESEAASDKTVSEKEILLNPLYQVQITLSDASVYEISSFGFEDIEKEAELCLEDDVLFIEYTSKESGKSVSTKDQEQAAKAQKAEAEKAAAEQAKAEQVAAEEAKAAKAAAEQAAAKQAKVEKSAVQQPAQQPVQKSAPKQAPAEVIPEQSTEGCLTEGGGPVFNE